jgi:hypothetical protein
MAGTGCQEEAVVEHVFDELVFRRAILTQFDEVQDSF